MLLLAYYPFDLKLSEAFTVSASSRTLTEAIFVEVKFENLTGYGQASFPPYMKERREDNLRFLSGVDLKTFSSPFEIKDILIYLNSLSLQNTPSKAAIDIALYDLMGKIKEVPVYELLGLKQDKKIFPSYTIGIGNDEFIVRQLAYAINYKSLKVKLNGDINYNKHAVELIRSHSNQPICIDFNGGLEDVAEAIKIIEWLADKNVIMIEQPLPVSREKDYKILKPNSPIHIYGDESIQNLTDLVDKRELFNGVNIKLMKCGGITNAFRMAHKARDLALKVMIGCMTESVCAVTAAAHLASLAEKVDLDGNLLITNDPFKGISINNGELIIPNIAGLGLEKID